MSVGNLFMLRQRVQWTPFVSKVGLAGEESFNTAAQKTLRARVIEKEQRIRTSGGEEIIADAVAWVHLPNGTIHRNDRIQLPSGKSPPILRVDEVPDLRGVVRIQKVFFGKSRAGAV